MADSSMDIEVSVDRQEIDNAINQAAREVETRFDFKDTGTTVAWAGEGIKLASNTEDRLIAALDVLKDKLVRRKVSLKSIEPGDIEPAGGATYKQDIALKQTMESDMAKAIVKQIKASKLKCTPTNMGDKVRVSSKSRDVLQEIMALVKAQDYDAPISFGNYK